MRDQKIHIIDDDLAVLDSLAILLNTAGLATECYSSGHDFIAAYTPGENECLLLDVQMPEMTGLELQLKLRELHITIPVIIMTGHGNVTTAVKAMQNGAVDFIEKPFRKDELLEKIYHALKISSDTNDNDSSLNRFRGLFADLTSREQDIFRQMVMGLSNKVIARNLDISFRTVEIHRSHVLKKMQVKNLSELIRLSIYTGIT
jgi:two-component system response regulator FixJ